VSGGALTLLLLAAALAAINVRASRRVLASDEDGYRKKLFVAGIWLVPLFGALAVKDVGRGLAPAGEPAPEPQEAPPSRIDVGDGRMFELKPYLGQIHGVPHLQWEEAMSHLGPDGSAAPSARTALRRGWLRHLRAWLGPQYRLHESATAVAVSSLDDVTVKALLRYVESTRVRVERVLQDVASFPPEEKSIVLVLDDEETYYHYVSTWYPDGGEFGFSGGMFIGHGCPHFVVKRNDLRAIEPVIAHELTHSALAHLQLPLWLDEGLAVNTERRLAGTTPHSHTAQQLHGKHVAFWDPDSIQEFWSGRSFHRSDDGQMLSYELARILVQEMSREWSTFAAFVRAAGRQDAGDAAARRQLGMDLGASVCALFDKDPSPRWSPDSRAWEAAAA